MSDRVVYCEGLSKSFGTTRAVESFDLEVSSGELVALLGPSGCGKTTALRMIAGLERPDAGELWVGDRHLSGAGTWVPPERRRVGLVFQDWALFPHLDVRRNVAFGRPDERGVDELLVMLGIEDLGDRMPHELSGGQQQRVALARALAPEPDVLLLDEPFSNLDATLRARVRSEVRQILHDAGVTAIFVTHDQEEALSIADRVAVMARGRILQVGAPWEVYREPASLDVAWMVGRANLLKASVQDRRASTALGSLDVTGSDEDGEGVVMIRPEHIRLTANDAGPGVITASEFYGHDQLVTVRLADATSLDVYAEGVDDHLEPGSRVHLEVDGSVRFFPAVPPQGVRPRQGVP